MWACAPVALQKTPLRLRRFRRRGRFLVVFMKEQETLGIRKNCVFLDFV